MADVLNSARESLLYVLSFGSTTTLWFLAAFLLGSLLVHIFGGESYE